MYFVVMHKKTLIWKYMNVSWLAISTGIKRGKLEDLFRTAKSVSLRKHNVYVSIPCKEYGEEPYRITGKEAKFLHELGRTHT